MLRKTLLFLSERNDVQAALLRVSAARQVARRFVAGDTLEETLERVRELNQRGFQVTLDYLGESVTEREEAARAAEAYRESLDRIARSPADSTLSLKLTQLGLDVDERFCTENLERIVARAAERDNFVRIDMEDSRHTEATLRIFRRVFEKYRNVGIVIQAYLHRSEEDVAELIRLGAPVRLCKGAYDEPPSAAYQRKVEVDRSFVRLMAMLLDGGAPTAIATHDEKMIEATRRHATEMGISKDAYEFQMLYGVRRAYQNHLLAEGFRMRIYVPYGSEWYPYFMRRMAERPANLWFVLRAMAGS
ncbi:MAG: proline dehydrogenase family protein [Gemmatimonadota bacterium]